MTQVLILRIEDDVAVIDVTGRAPADAPLFAEQVGDLAHMPVDWAVVEAIKLDDVGPGDVADNLAEPDELPTATLRRYEP